MKKDALDIKGKIRKSSLQKAWDRIGVSHHHGINIPLFSLHSKDSCGIGEFLDLKLLVDFCKTIDRDIIQLLPLNDSGYETSPYNAVSSKALNPIYLSLKALPFCDSDDELQYELKGFKKYTHLQRVAYNAVLSAKLDFLRLYFKKYFQTYQNTPVYRAFITHNPWLFEYGLFKTLKEEYAHKGWFSWKKKHQHPTATLKKSMIKEREDSVNFFIFLQYLSFSQLEDVKEYAEKKHVFIKGDIPILISPESLDVWQGGEDFDLTFSAGAPPDALCPEGQNWGFPIYNWKHIEKTDYLFWRDRLQIASRFYHLYRIDHIIGLYNIFAIPRNESISKGSYIPPDHSLAIFQGNSILDKFISLTNMLPIGEDLGTVRDEIKENMDEHALPGTRVPRWEKAKGTFVHSDTYSPISLTTVSTHDSETLTLWWDNNPKEAKLFASSYGIEYQAEISGAIRYRLLKDSHTSTSLFHINLLSEYLALFDDLVWDDPEEERINLPGTILPSNWCYKTRPSLEMLLEHTDLKLAMKSMLNEEAA